MWHFNSGTPSSAGHRHGTLQPMIDLKLWSCLSHHSIQSGFMCNARDSCKDWPTIAIQTLWQILLSKVSQSMTLAWFFREPKQLIVFGCVQIMTGSCAVYASTAMMKEYILATYVPTVSLSVHLHPSGLSTFSVCTNLFYLLFLFVVKTEIGSCQVCVHLNLKCLNRRVETKYDHPQLYKLYCINILYYSIH